MRRAVDDALLPAMKGNTDGNDPKTNDAPENTPALSGDRSSVLTTPNSSATMIFNKASGWLQ